MEAATVQGPPPPSSFCSTVGHTLRSGYTVVRQGLDSVGRKYIHLTEQLFRGNQTYAAIFRIATNTLLALSINASLMLTPLNPWLIFGVCSFGEMALRGFNGKTLYFPTGVTLQWLLQSITLRQPFPQLFSIHRFSALSIGLHALVTVTTATSLCLRLFMDKKDDSSWILHSNHFDDEMTERKPLVDR